jgi:hypothetical protein
MRAYRSPLKLFVFGIIGIVLIAAASDVLFGHWLSTAPDTIDTALTTRGRAQQRGDILWGGVMLVSGVLIFGGSVVELFRRRATVVVGSEGLVVDSGSIEGHIPWGNIESISSTVISDPYDGSMREQLVVELQPDTDVDDAVAGPTPDGETIYVDAHDWSSRVTEVALAAQGAHDHFQRMEAVRSYEPPSIVWETTVDQSDVAESDGDTSDGGAEESDE